MKQKRKRLTFGAVTALALTIFTGYALLDTFVIPRSYGAVPQTVDVAAEEVQTAVQETSLQEEIEQEESTQDGITVELTEYRENDTTIYAADVWVTDPSQLKTAFANGTYGKNVKDATSDIAEDADAILAVNGDFYGARNSGYVIRNGVLYRSTSSGAEDLVIYEDGSFAIIDEDDVTAEQLLEDGAMQVLSFGPALIEDGEIAVTKNEEVSKAMASNPRTAIGIYEDGHYVFVVSDGRTDESEGLSLYELAEFLQELGVETAYNLDGGG
ncbi:MAG: phosphodiester glycosidase family protein, partial [Firmicutes bacterium]|nr:phosphodiester glycosidase family protein [Bacillota bacterium]